MFIEWATHCQHVVERPAGDMDIMGLGRTGAIIEDGLPAQVECPVVICLRPDEDDETGMMFGFSYRVLNPHGTVVDEGRADIELRIPSAPRLQEPRRCYKVLKINILVEESGQYAVELGLDGGEQIRLPYSFSAWSL